MAALAIMPLVGFDVSGAPATYVVTSTADLVDNNIGDGSCISSNGQCTLRAAIQEANNTTSPDTINIVTQGTYALTRAPINDNGADSGDLDILRPVTINGTGPGTTIVDAGTPPGGAPPEQLGMDRLFELHETAGAVTIRGLAMREGYAGEEGGALYNLSPGTVRLENVHVLDSFATAYGGGISSIGGGRLDLVGVRITGNDTVGEGGGINVTSGALTVTGTSQAPSVIGGNTAREGGGIYHGGEDSPAGLPSSVSLTHTTVEDNTSEVMGGGVSVTGDNAFAATDSTFQDNVAGTDISQAEGGGIAVSGEASASMTRGLVARNTAFGNGGGAMVESGRSMRFDDVTFEENKAGDPVSGDGGGGGLFAGGTGSLTINRGLFEGNDSVSTGGGLTLETGGPATIVGTVFTANHSGAGGGGFTNSGDRVTATGVRLESNTSDGPGGGILGEGSGDFNLVNSDLRHNSSINGGGFANEADGTTNISSTTFWANYARVGGEEPADSGLGGGVFSEGDASATYENVTIAGNFAQTRGGGFYVDADAPVRVVNTTISQNTAPVAAGVGSEVTVAPIPPEPSTGVIFRNTIVAGNNLGEECNFAVGSEGGNIDEGDTCYFRGVRDRMKVGDPRLDAVADNGGPVMTMALHDDSYAINGGVMPCAITDARGVHRPQPQPSGACDSGAFEYEGPFGPPDNVKPDTWIIDPPTSVGEYYTFRFGASDNVTPLSEMLFECRLRQWPLEEPPDPTEPPEPEDMWIGCPNPWEIMDLFEEGQNLLEVRAVDRAGNVDDESPAELIFTAGIDVTPPTVQWTFTPQDGPGSTAVFGFTANDDLTPQVLLETECRLDSTDENAWLECASPHSVSNLAPGPHRFEVRAIDEGDNISQELVHEWDVTNPTNCTDVNVTVVADADAHVSEVETEENFGADDTISVASGSPGQDSRAFVKFPMPNGIPAGCTLASAKLRLTGDGDAGRTIQAVPITSSWEELEVTWLNQPTAAGTTSTVHSGAGQRQWDVTSQVNGWLSNPASNYGLLIRDAAEEDEFGAEQSYDSRHTEQDPTQPSTLPQLVLRFDGQGEDPPGPTPAPVDVAPTCGMEVEYSIRLTAGLTNCPVDGLVVTRPNVTIDLNGFTIDGPGYFEGEPGSPIELPELGGPAGIRNPGFRNVHIIGGVNAQTGLPGTVQSFLYGVQFAAGSRFGSISGLDIRRNALAGVELVDTDNGRNGNVISDNRFIDNELGLSLMAGTEHQVVENNEFQGNLGYAIWAQEAAFNTFTGNHISGITSDPLLSSDGGLWMTASPDNVFVGNTVVDTGDGGFVLGEGSHRNRFHQNKFGRVGDAGISASGSDFLEITENGAHQSSDAGIVVEDGHGGYIARNHVEYNPGGIELDGVTGMVVEENWADWTLGSGISLGGESLGNTVRRNFARYTNGSGIEVDVDGLSELGAPIGNLIEDNVTHQNDSDGISITGGGHTVRGNQSHNNAAWGIQASEQTVDGGANTANGNGEPPQCENVLCGPGTTVPVLPEEWTNPDTQILTHPAPMQSMMDPNTFTFTGTDNVPAGVDPSLVLRYECRLDAPPDPPAPEPEPGEPPQPPDVDNWVECFNPTTYMFLPIGQHKFEVRAVDPFDNVDLSPAEFIWTVLAAPPGLDIVPPKTTISVAPANPNHLTSFSFGFRGTDNMTPGPYLRYQCKLDQTPGAAGSWETCSPGHTVNNLAPGITYTFSVKAIDLQNNEDPSPATHTWSQIDPPADLTDPETMISSGPDPTTVDTTAEFTFTSDDPTATFQCRPDSGAWLACTSPHTVSQLTVGPHLFEVRAVDPAGNVDESPAAFSWSVGQAPVDLAVNCGQVITQSVRVTEDLLDCPSDGLVIGADSITLDLGGVMIDGTGSGVGVRNNGFDSVTIRNGTVQQFAVGVQLGAGTALGIVTGVTAQLNTDVGVWFDNADDGSSGSTVRSNLLAGNSHGIRVTGTEGARISDNTVGGTAEDAIALVTSSGSWVERNTISSTSGMGIYLEGSTNNNLSSNTISGTSKQAISLQLGSTGNRIEGNALSDSEVGVELLESGDNMVIANEATGMAEAGVLVDTSDNNQIVGNNVSSNGNGVDLYFANGNEVRNNIASGNSSTGIAVGDQSLDNDIVGNTAGQNDSEGISVEAEVLPESTLPGNRIMQNNASGNSADGISVNKPTHTITANVANNNGGWGMYAEPLNTDGGGNRASGNVELEQCYNIVCDGGPPMGPEINPPDTYFVTKPDNPNYSRSATFIFGGTDDNTSPYELEFECRLDSTDELDWVSCENPTVFSNLSAGWHNFQVRAIDAAEKPDPSPATHPWLIEELPTGVPPDTFIVSGPTSSPLEEVEIHFGSNEPDSTYLCSLDDAPYTACATPYVIEELQFGPHVFRVKAVDDEGHVDPSAAEHLWTRIGPPVVTITSGPEEVTTSRRAEFTFVANEPVQRFECSLDLVPYTTCTSPIEYTGLAVGEHFLRVRAVDLDGLTSGPDELAEFEWTVEPGTDIVPPNAFFTLVPGDPSDSATFEFSGTDDVTAPDGLIFECRLDSEDEGDFAECTSPWTYPNPDFPEPLTPGEHFVDLRAVDEQDNIDPSPVRHTWTFTGDTTAPTVQLLSGPPATTAITSATFAFTANDPYAEFECSHVTGPDPGFEPCSSPHEVSGLEPGAHTVEIRAIDLNGNIGASHVANWTVVAPPVVTFLTTPPATTAATTATFTFSSSEPGSAFVCSLDGAQFTACTSPVNLSGLAVGSHHFAVRASALGAVGEQVYYEWTVEPPPDTIAPVTTMVTGPPATSSEPTATFTFASSEPGSTFTCSLDTAPFTACSSPVNLTGLAAGPHQFRMVATDAAGNADLTPEVHNWTVEESAPEPPPCTAGPITLGSGRDSWVLQGSSSNYGSDSVIKVESKSGNNARALVRFELPTLPEGCTVASAALRMYSASYDGGRTLQAVRLAGTWTENGVTWSNQPATTGAAATTTSGSGYRQWTVTDAVLAMYGGAANHGFLIRDASEGGSGQKTELHSREKGSDNPPRLVLTLGSATPPGGGDTTPPQTTIDTAPSGSTTSTSATFTFSSSEAGSTFACSLDGAAFAACTSPVNLTGLAAGAHQFRVKATDGAGNTDDSPATHNWTVTLGGCSAPGTVTASSAADSWVLQSSSSSNYGSDSVVKVDAKSGNNARSMFRFNLPSVPAGCSVTGATLRLYSSSYKSGRTLQALRVTASWTEGNVNWNNQPSTGGPAATTSSGSGWRQWSVADQVAAMYGTANHGFLIRDATEGGSGNEQSFHSREKGSDNPPQLVITFG